MTREQVTSSDTMAEHGSGSARRSHHDHRSRRTAKSFPPGADVEFAALACW